MYTVAPVVDNNTPTVTIRKATRPCGYSSTHSSLISPYGSAFCSTRDSTSASTFASTSWTTSKVGSGAWATASCLIWAGWALCSSIVCGVTAYFSVGSSMISTFLLANSSIWTGFREILVSDLTPLPYHELNGTNEKVSWQLSLLSVVHSSSSWL